MASLLIAHPGDRWFLLNSFEPAHPHFQWREWQRRKKTMVNARIDQWWQRTKSYSMFSSDTCVCTPLHCEVHGQTTMERQKGTSIRSPIRRQPVLIEQHFSEVRMNRTRRGIIVPLLPMNTIEHYTILNCTINEKQASSSRNRPKLDPTSIVSSAEAIPLVFETFQYIIRTEVKNDYEFASLNTPSLLKLHSSPLVVETVRFLHSKLIQPETISL